jgi:CBS domain containing-hemolysin-like protein
MRKDETLADAIENYLKGCQRVLVTDKEGHVIGVVSQSTIAKYLEENIHRIKYDRLFNGTVWDFPFKSTSVSVVKQDTKVLDALAHMRARNLMAVGVTDETGRLVGNLSASDLQSWHLFGPKFHRLGWSVARFLKSLRRTQARQADFVVCVQRDTTVLELLTVFGTYSVHRVYIIDENGMPSGVISLTDIMKGLSGDLRKGQYQGPEVFTTGTTTTTGISKEQGVAGGSGAGEKQPAFESS